VRHRLRSQLQWRWDGVGQGMGAAHHRWPNEWFAHRGRLSLKTEHEWTRTIVGLRTHGLESRMREIRPSGSEGGASFNPLSLPLSLKKSAAVGLAKAHRRLEIAAAGGTATRRRQLCRRRGDEALTRCQRSVV